jgi:hypothetical protein
MKCVRIWFRIELLEIECSMITQKENDGDFYLRILYSFFAVNGKQLLKEPYVTTSAKTQIKKE